MSVKLMGQVFDLDLPMKQAWVLIALADHAEHDGSKMFPSVGALARKCGMSPRSVQRVLRGLETAGAITLVRKESDHRPREYQATFERVAKKAERGDSMVTPRQIDAPSKPFVLEPTGVTERAERGDRAVSPESKATVSKENRPSSARAERAHALEGFEDFQRLYPRRRDWDDARKAWRKLAPDPALRARILAAVRAQAASPEWRDDLAQHRGKHIPYPASWLNARRWEDELDVPGAPCAVPVTRMPADAEFRAMQQRMAEARARRQAERQAAS